VPNSKIKDILKAFLLLKTLVKAGDKICMPKDEFIAEHVKLLNTLKHPTKEKLEDEAEEQSSELDEELEKGQNGDWQKEGYTVHTIDPESMDPSDKTDLAETVIARSPMGNEVARLNLGVLSNGTAYPRLMSVDKYHQRKGLASAMYAHAEKHFGVKMTPGNRSDDARALWNQPNRPFGKSESLVKAPSEAARVNIQPRHLDQYAAQDIKNNAHIETRPLGIPQDKSVNVYGRIINSPANGQDLFHHIISDTDGNKTHHKLSTSENPEDHALVNLMVEHYQGYPDWKGIPTAKLAISRDPGFGLGFKLYEEALKHHGRLQSDSMITDAAHKLWAKLLKHPDVKGHLGALGAGEDRHYAEWNGLHKSEELAKAVRLRPTKEGQLDESTGDIAKIHSNGNLMWHAGPDKARSHDTTLRNQDLINKYTQSFRHETHRKVFPKIVQNILNDPNRHFIPTEENGSHRLRARHIKNLLLGDPNYKMDLSDPNKILITALKRHGSDESPTTWTYNIVQKGAENEKLKRSEGPNKRRGFRDFEAILESVRCGGDDRGYTRDLEEGGNEQVSTRRNTGYRDGLDKSEKPVNPKDPVLGPKRVVKPPRKDWQTRIKAYIEHQNKKKTSSPTREHSDTEMWSGLLDHLKKSDDSWQQSYLHHKDQEIPTILHHYSRQSGLSEINPKKMGTGAPGHFSRNFDPSKIPNFPHTSFYYIDPTKAEDVVKTGAKSKYTVKMHPHHKLYDLTEDKAGLVKQARAENNGAWNYEAVLDKIKNAGYHGTWAPKSDDPVIANTVQLFHPQVPTSEERFE
jgi:hypothetical protein